MTELQDARMRWLDAEHRCLNLQQENAHLQSKNHELRMKLITEACQSSCAQISLAALSPLLFLGNSHDRR